MKTIKMATLPFTFLALALMLGGCAGAEPIEADEALDAQPAAQAEPEEETAEAASALTTVWDCYRVRDNVYQGTVSIWWGHTPGDAAWACNNWISSCGNSPGGCFAL